MLREISLRLPGVPKVLRYRLLAHKGPGMPILYELRGHVAVITLSRPERRNAWCPEFYDELLRRFTDADADRCVRFVVLTGAEAGGAFSAGADRTDDATHRVPSHPETAQAFPW